MAEEAFHITTVETRHLCEHLDCTSDIDDLDGALSDAGYVRLDHGTTPGSKISIMETKLPAGRDPGHRGPAISLATNLFYIIHANGKPEPERLRNAYETAVQTIATDAIGEKIITALAAYSAKNDPGMKPMITEGPYGISEYAMASIAYETARYGNVITDVAIERVYEIGGHDEDWQKMVMANMRAEEPIVRVKKHNPEKYENLGIDPPVAEILSWLQVNPEVQAEEFIRYASHVGIDPNHAAQRIASALGVLPQIENKQSDH